MTATPQDAQVVSPQWLADHLGQAGLRIIDCTTWMQPNPVGASTMTSARAHWANAHLPGSIHWDLVDDFSSCDGDWAFTRPRKGELATLLSRSGIAPDDRIVLYGARHPNIVTRAWWVLHSLGLSQVSVLDGGFEYWNQLGLPLDTEATPWPTTQWRPDDFRSRGYADMDDVRRALDGDAVLVNALSAGQFAGDTTLPHYGRPGRIPHSVSLPASSLHNEGRFLPPDVMHDAAIAAGVPSDRHTPIITYCGGGLAASMAYFCLLRAGWTQLRLYDASLLEWSSKPELPMV